MSLCRCDFCRAFYDRQGKAGATKSLWMGETGRRNYRRAQEASLAVLNPAKTGTPYGEDEDALVFNFNLTITEIACRLGRTHASVMNRRRRLRKIAAAGVH